MRRRIRAQFMTTDGVLRRHKNGKKYYRTEHIVLEFESYEDMMDWRAIHKAALEWWWYIDSPKRDPE